jgi:HPt (histidine-containing phosphotransfer) domain-containing protein
MDDYLTKPFSLDQLRGCVDRCHEMRAIGVAWDAIAPPVPQFNEAGMVAAAKSAAGHIEPGEVHIAKEWLADDTGTEQLIDPAELILTDSINHALANEPADKSAKIMNRTVVRDEKAVCFETLESIISLDPENGAGLLSRLIGIYENNSAELLQSIQASFEAGDAIALSKAAHALKSSSGNVGAERLAKLCKGIELAARNGDLVSVAAEIEMLFLEQGRVIEMLHDYQPEELA